MIVLVTLLLSIGKCTFIDQWSISLECFLENIPGTIKLVTAPIWWILKIIWNLLPKIITKRVEKLYNKIAGFLTTFIKKVYRVVEKWKKRPKE